MKKLLLLLLIFFSLTTFSQNTLKYDIKKEPTKASLEQASWIEGYWKGKAMGGIIEEVWTAPLGGSMMGSFKLVIDDTIQFYELCTISEENGTILLRIKHFNKDLQGWEEKDKSEEFKLVKIASNKAYFDGITFIRDNKKLSIFVVIDNEEMQFKYKLIK